MIKSVFAQHIEKSIKQQNLSDRNISAGSEPNVGKVRKKRNDYLASNFYCQKGFDQLLNTSKVKETLLAASILWNFWNNEVGNMVSGIPGILKFTARILKVDKQLKSLGIWGEKMAKYGIHWIKTVYSK